MRRGKRRRGRRQECSSTASNCWARTQSFGTERGGDMDAAAKRQPEIQTPEENHPALNAILGANPFVGLDSMQVVGTLTTLLTHLASQPAAVASRVLQLGLE